MARITVTLSASEREALRQSAEHDLRDLRGQARYLIVKALAAEIVAQTPDLSQPAEGIPNARQA